ncbi:MAG: hypothetical protein PHH47_05165 [Gallionella sp.]|nr:hypothetical protein [Gallionella sp.]MDD4945472.1 hypothetical protein [Gallionella sp.]MDD5612213.1 hypothetical protein [Gallionella sp.]
MKRTSPSRRSGEVSPNGIENALMGLPDFIKTAERVEVAGIIAIGIGLAKQQA